MMDKIRIIFLGGEAVKQLINVLNLYCNNMIKVIRILILITDNLKTMLIILLYKYII